MSNVNGNDDQFFQTIPRIPEGLYGPGIKGFFRYVASWCHDPFVGRYQATNKTVYQMYLDGELYKRQVEYIRNNYVNATEAGFNDKDSALNRFFWHYNKDGKMDKAEQNWWEALFEDAYNSVPLVKPTPAQSKTKFEIMFEAFKEEFVFDTQLGMSEAAAGQFGICVHEGPEQVKEFFRLSTAIAFIIWTMPVTMSFFESGCGIRSAKGKTWGEVFKKGIEDAKETWKKATDNIDTFHPFVNAIIETAMIMIPWAIMCYCGFGVNYWMYAYMDTALMIKSKLLSGGWSSKTEFVKDIFVHSFIGYIRGLQKYCLMTYWLMPKNLSAYQMIVGDNLLTALSSLTGKAMHTFGSKSIFTRSWFWGVAFCGMAFAAHTFKEMTDTCEIVNGHRTCITMDMEKELIMAPAVLAVICFAIAMWRKGTYY